jgi:hypothetical protein
MVLAGDTKLLDALPPGMKIQKLDAAAGLEQGLKVKKMDPVAGSEPGLKVKKADAVDVPPVKGKGMKPDKPGRDGN